MWRALSPHSPGAAAPGGCTLRLIPLPCRNNGGTAGRYHPWVPQRSQPRSPPAAELKRNTDCAQQEENNENECTELFSACSLNPRSPRPGFQTSATVGTHPTRKNIQANIKFFIVSEVFPFQSQFSAITSLLRSSLLFSSPPHHLSSCLDCWGLNRQTCDHR